MRKRNQWVESGDIYYDLGVIAVIVILTLKSWYDFYTTPSLFTSLFATVLCLPWLITGCVCLYRVINRKSGNSQGFSEDGLESDRIDDLSRVVS
jgi:hypothetical protein